MLDDERLAKIYAGDLMRVKFYGPMVVRAKLYEKGVDKSLAENAVRQALEDNDGEIELCRKCLNKKIDSQADLKTKLRRLATKGFSGSAIRAVLKNTDEYFID
jgi:SOS response regulatory protein OraA/RecX